MMLSMVLWQDFLFSIPGFIVVALYGAATGSFLNVVAYRLPRGISIVAPRSRCPRCCLSIRPWHNLPVIGWIFLRGRCRDCRGAISVRYPLVEGLTSALFVGSFLHQQDFASALLSSAIASWALVLALMDLDLRVLPDSLTLPAIGLGLWAQHGAGRARFLDALAASACAYVGLTLFARLWQVSFGDEGFGVGDIRFSAALGAIFGSGGLLVIFLASTVLALGMGLILRLAGRGNDSVAFGAALSLSTMIYLLGGIPPGAFQ